MTRSSSALRIYVADDPDSDILVRALVGAD
jgi:hypothetical protein